MITVRETDFSSVVSNAGPVVSLIVAASGPLQTPKMIGKWRRQRYQYLSRLRKTQYLRDWRAGHIQQLELERAFGAPNTKDRK